MDKTLLDTDIFSEILKKRNVNVKERAESYHAVFRRYTVSVITVTEIVRGFHKARREDGIQRFLAAMLSAEILTLNLKRSELAGRIYADLEGAGQTIGRADPMIAAIALENDLILTTGNTEHYQRIQRLNYPLKLDNWK